MCMRVCDYVCVCVPMCECGVWVNWTVSLCVKFMCGCGIGCVCECVRVCVCVRTFVCSYIDTLFSLGCFLSGRGPNVALTKVKFSECFPYSISKKEVEVSFEMTQFVFKISLRRGVIMTLCRQYDVMMS